MFIFLPEAVTGNSLSRFQMDTIYGIFCQTITGPQNQPFSLRVIEVNAAIVGSHVFTDNTDNLPQKTLYILTPGKKSCQFADRADCIN